MISCTVGIIGEPVQPQVMFKVAIGDYTWLIIFFEVQKNLEVDVRVTKELIWSELEVIQQPNNESTHW